MFNLFLFNAVFLARHAGENQSFRQVTETPRWFEKPPELSELTILRIK
jgi:hypothetical protein